MSLGINTKEIVFMAKSQIMRDYQPDIIENANKDIFELTKPLIKNLNLRSQELYQTSTATNLNLINEVKIRLFNKRNSFCYKRESSLNETVTVKVKLRKPVRKHFSKTVKQDSTVTKRRTVIKFPEITVTKVFIKLTENYGQTKFSARTFGTKIGHGHSPSHFEQDCTTISAHEINRRSPQNKKQHLTTHQAQAPLMTHQQATLMTHHLFQSTLLI